VKAKKKRFGGHLGFQNGRQKCNVARKKVSKRYIFGSGALRKTIFAPNESLSDPR
jgi:hypothetical protein